MPYWDSVEPLEPIAPGQADDPDDHPLEPRCWCGRILLFWRTADGNKRPYCTAHGKDFRPDE